MSFWNLCAFWFIYFLSIFVFDFILWTKILFWFWLFCYFSVTIIIMIMCVCVYGTLYSAQDFIIRSADLFLPCPEEAQCATLSRSWKGTVRQNRKAFILRIGWRTQSLTALQMPHLLCKWFMISDDVKVKVSRYIEPPSGGFILQEEAFIWGEVFIYFVFKGYWSRRCNMCGQHRA